MQKNFRQKTVYLYRSTCQPLHTRKYMDTLLSMVSFLVASSHETFVKENQCFFGEEAIVESVENCGRAGNKSAFGVVPNERKQKNTNPEKTSRFLTFLNLRKMSHSTEKKHTFFLSYKILT